MSKDFLDSDLFAPMSEDEYANFEQELLPQNNAKRADAVSLAKTVKDMAQNFDHLFEK
jgi:hypothetical protein